MNHDDEFIGRLEDYLETFDGVTPLPDWVRDAVHADLPRTRQARPAPGLQRMLHMISHASAGARWGLAGAVVVAAVVVGAAVINNGSSSSGIGAPPATASAAPTPVPTPTPAPSSAALPGPDETDATSPGSYLAGDPFLTPFTVTLPAGWSGHIGGPFAVFLGRTVHIGRYMSIGLTLSQSLYADPCTGAGLLKTQPGPTVDDLATALAHEPGFTSTVPTAVTVDGHAGKQLTLTAPDSFKRCKLTADGYRLWTLPLGAIQSFTPGQQTALTILDVGGQRLVISSDTNPATTQQDRAEIQQVLDSIHFDTTN